jgi:hypothetical protein
LAPSRPADGPVNVSFRGKADARLRRTNTYLNSMPYIRHPATCTPSKVAARGRSLPCREATRLGKLSALLQHENSNDVARQSATTKGHTVVCPLVMERAIAYLRVSTQRQHRSGLGLEAQRTTIERFATAESFTILAEYVEAETGKGSDALDRRPSWPLRRPRSAA